MFYEKVVNRDFVIFNRIKRKSFFVKSYNYINAQDILALFKAETEE